MITDNDRAVSTVVAAMLLLVVITTFMSVINAYYIPSLSAKHEIDHMREVQESFQKIEETVSLYSYIESKNPSTGRTPEAKVTIPLGDGGLPLISTLSSSGSVATKPDASSINVSFYYRNSPNGTPYLNFTESSGYFKYFATNNFWIDQELAFDNGALVLTQGERSLIKSEPFISISNNSNKCLEIALFNVIGDAQSLSGNGRSTIKLSVKHNDSKSVSLQYIDNVTITTISPSAHHAKSWHDYFLREAQSDPLTYIDIAQPQNDTKVTVNLTAFDYLNISVSDVEFEIM